MYENSQLSFKRFSKYGIPIANLDKKGKEKIKKYLEKEYIQQILMIIYIYIILYIN